MEHFIASYGYVAVFMLMLAESACIPVPSEVVMMFGGALAAGAVAGAHPSLAGIIAAGAAGNVAGSYLAWAAGRYGGQAAVSRWGRRIGLREHHVDKAAAWFGRHGPAAVFFGRMVPVVRTFISLPAGFARMPAGRFGAYTAAGCVPWTAGLGVAGYALGRNWRSVASDFHGPTYVIAAIVVIGLAAAVFLHFRRPRSTGAHAAGSRRPTRTPASQPTRTPASQPTRTPASQPTRTPASQPTRYLPAPPPGHLPAPPPHGRGTAGPPGPPGPRGPGRPRPLAPSAPPPDQPSWQYGLPTRPRSGDAPSGYPGQGW